MASYEGKGATGKVYKEMRNGQHVAVKKVPENYMTQHDMDREYRIYKTAAHPNIVKIVERPRIHSDNKWHIIMEYIFGETLEKTIFNREDSSIKLTSRIKSKIITGMCEGLFHLHNNDIVHQDLKPDNIMVKSNTYEAVIIDLGFAKFYRDGLNSALNIGNTAYAAPEIRVDPCVQRDHRSDVWAMGKIIAEILIGCQIHHTSPAYIQKTLRGNVYCDVVSRMLDGSPTPRATMAQVITEIREAGGVAGGGAAECSSMYGPCNMSVQHYQSYGFGSLGLPSDIPLPYSVPRNCTIDIGHNKYSHDGNLESSIKANVRIVDGRPREAGWARVTPNEGGHELED